MKKGDKVILRKYESCDSLNWWGGEYWVNRETIVETIDDTDGTFMFAEGCWWLQSACDLLVPSEPVKNERYFLFTIVSGDKTGNIRIKNTDNKIPSNKYIKQVAKEDFNCDNAAIVNIFEFKTEKDWLDFNSNE